jgi:hypothetical protein
MMHYEDAAFVLFLSVWRGFKIYWWWRLNSLSTFLQVNCDCDKAVLSKPTFIWHQLLHVTTLVDFPPSPEVEDRPKQLVLDPSDRSGDFSQYPAPLRFYSKSSA